MSWDTQGVWTEPGARFDLRFEYIDQDQPRAGSDRVSVGQISHHHDEVRTINRNWFATFDYNFNAHWGVSAMLPMTDRDHSHIHNHHGDQLTETWNFSELGDMRVVGRRQWRSESRETQRVDVFGVNFGLELPTGEIDVENASGDLAERSLQPGTGTTDLLVGASYTRVLRSNSSWFANLLMQQPLNSHEDFKPGRQAGFDVGYRWGTTDRLTLMLQLNALYKDRDEGEEAEPDASGGKSVFVSPGLSYAIVKQVQLYGFLQKPIYQHVNGVQLTNDWGAVAGISARF
jgi:hypothetical protein